MTGAATLPDPAAGWVDEFRRDVADHFVEEGVPARHRPDVTAVFEDFVRRDLRRHLGPSLAPRSQREVLRRLHRLAVQREAVVSVLYEPARAGPWFGDLLERLLVRVWDDEIVHEAYLSGVSRDERRLRLERWMGYQGGLAAAVAAGAPAGAAMAAWARAVRLAGRASGLIASAVDPARVRREPGAWCARQAALELTAAVAYEVFSHLAAEAQVAQPHLRVRADRLAWKLSQIADEELWHADLFARMCRAVCGEERADDLAALEDAARLTRRPGRWPAPARVTGTPASLLPRDRGGDRRPPRRVGGRHPASGEEPAADLLLRMLPSVDWSARGRLPFVTIACSTRLAPGRLAKDRLLCTVVGAVAEWCRANDREADIWVVGPAAPYAPSRRAASPGRRLVGTGMLARNVGTTSSIGDAAEALRTADEVVAGGTLLVTTYGSFVASNADVLHRVWDLWAYSALRLCLSPARSAFATLGQVVHSELDFPSGPALDAPPLVVDVPRLRELAALRLLGAYPPDLTVLWQPTGRAAAGTDLVAAGRLLLGDRHPEMRAGSAWRMASVIASTPAGSASGPAGARTDTEGDAPPSGAQAGARSSPEPVPLPEVTGPWSGRPPDPTSSLVYVYRHRAGEGVALDGVDVTTPWDDLGADARPAVLETMRKRTEEAPARGEDYEAQVLEGILHPGPGPFGDVDEVLARASAALGEPLRVQDCVECNDIFALVTGDEGRWRPLFPSPLVSALYRRGRAVGR